MRSVIFAFLAMLCWGIGPILAKTGLVSLEPFSALIIRSISVAVVLLITGLLTGKMAALFHVELRAVSFMIGEGILAAFLGQMAYFYALKIGEASVITPITAAFPIITLVLAVVLLGENFSVQRIVGSALIVAGVIIINR
ncbi:MAG: EamA family transporter [Eubacteriales bacterium]|jgi:transporter family protein